MTLSSLSSFSTALTTGTIIAIVLGSVCGLFVTIGSIITILCLVKHMNRRRIITNRGIGLQQPQSYQYPQSWSQQYPPINVTSVANYPSPYQSYIPPYTASQSTY